MALVCDYCGDVTKSQERVSVAFDHNQEIALKGATAQEWFYYCNDECAEAVKAMLENLRLYAMHGEGSGLMWQLVQQPTLADSDDELEPPQPVKTEAQAKAREKNIEAVRDKRLPDLLGWSGPSPEDQPARAKQGTALDALLPHYPTTRKIIESGNVVTLEEVAELCEAQFCGIYGVGASTLQAVHAALKAKGLTFIDGPSGHQLRQALRESIRKRDINPNDVTSMILEKVGHPEKIEGEHTQASWELFTAIGKLWEKGTPPPPYVLERIADIFGYTTKSFLEFAARMPTEAS